MAVEGPSALSFTVLAESAAELERAYAAVKDDVAEIVEKETEKAEIVEQRRAAEREEQEAEKERVAERARTLQEAATRKREAEEVPLSDAAVAVAQNGTFSEFMEQLKKDQVAWSVDKVKAVFRSYRPVASAPVVKNDEELTAALWPLDFEAPTRRKKGRFAPCLPGRSWN